MKIKYKSCLYAGVIGAAALLLLLTNVSLNAEVKDAEGIPAWEWTKENPKPDWWTWGSEKEKPVRGGYIHVATGAYIGLMNPNHWPVRDWVTINNLYETLSYVDGSYRPRSLWLAKSYEFLDPVTCILKLRKGIQFHDGSKFNAEAVKYTVDYIKDKKNGAWTRSWLAMVKSVEVVDEYTLKWNFKKPWAGFLGVMSTTPSFIISKQALEKDVAMKELKKAKSKLKRALSKVAKAEKKARTASGDKAVKATKSAEKARKKAAELKKRVAGLTEKAKGAKDVDHNPVGTGKYMLEAAKPGNYLKLKRNPNWWFGKSVGIPDLPHADGVLITVIPDESIRLANLRAGKLDYMVLTSTQFLDLKGDPKFQIASYPGNHMGSMVFNHVKGPCRDIRVRKAISHAIDRKALIAGLYHGQGIVASGPYMSAHWSHNPNLKPVEYNPELSKKLLAEAGYSKGLTIRGHMGSSAGSVSTTEAIKAMLAKVGITWKVDSLSGAASSDRSKNLEYDFAGGGWAFIEDPDMLATGLYHPDGGFNHGRTNNPRAVELIEAGRVELDFDKRQKIYWELERVLYENYEDAWISYPLINVARSSRLLGYDVKKHIKGGEFYYYSHPGWFKDGRRSAK